MLKAVVDTNVLISGLLKTSVTSRKIIQKLSEKEFELVISPQILEEFIDVISRPKFHNVIVRETAEKLMEVIKTGTILVNPSKSVNVIKEDPDDDRFLETALESKADLIISGDHHLLSLKTFNKIPIITPKDFLRYLKKG